ncbi:suppressor of fused domain protein [Pedobacter gandavensis]|uniref:suppressor of fused domain protein n=1 Tax=Pedobacter gandavensis TaxID=2679963 RepID=UPI00292D9755|nr:suppressor of fused domain protein [Pedobacter gandavensis]
MSYNIEDYKGKIINHYSSIWGGDFQEKKWLKGPIMRVAPHFCVLEYKPYPSRKMWTYATCCMSTNTHQAPIEVHIFSSVQDDSIIELLSEVCYYHNVEANLDLGHTVNFGRPWQDYSKSSFGLLSLPYLNGPKLEIMHLANNKDIHFYWLIPITKTEVEYKKEFGLEALETKFDADNFNYLNPNRRSAV